MKKLFCILLIFFAGFSVKATHIVGGEFQLIWKQGYNYALEMNFYYDELSTIASGSQYLLEEDLIIEVAIYEKVTNKLMELDTLKRISDGFIGYQYVQCTNYNSTKVETRLLKYVVNNNSQTIELSPTKYNSSNGYYVVWERCCRNVSIANIVNPDQVGQVFYLEFPSLAYGVPGGYAFNSEPIFKILTGDFPCVGRPFTFDFSGIDPNGDSLVYSMVTPLAGYSSLDGYGPGAEPIPPDASNAYAASYPLITWKPGYGALDAIHGNPPLSIDPHTGILSVTANTTGLFAFGVLVQEYRKGIKIGEVRRDFQFNVISCPAYPGPAITLQVPGTTQSYTATDTIKIQMKSKDTCFTALISDTSTDIKYLQTQAINISNITPNIPSGLLQIAALVNLPTTQTSEPVPKSTPLCFNSCYNLNIDKDTLIDFTIVVADASCPAPKTDTLKIKVLFIPPNVPKPSIVTVPDLDNDTLVANQPPIDFNVIGTVKGYQLTLTGNGKGFNFSDYGMSYSTPVTGVDSVASVFSWKVPCSAVGKSPFILQFIASDSNCGLNRADTSLITLYVKDIETTLGEMKGYNVVTPNGDGKNDSLVLYHPPNMPTPPDNCEYYFKSITVYNRWGGEVFVDTSRNFAWDPNMSHVPDGVYYYLIDLNAKKVKGWVEVIR